MLLVFQTNEWKLQIVLAYRNSQVEIQLTCPSVCLSPQMLSPYNKGLFRRAITQCGVALSPWALQKNPMALTKKVPEPAAVLLMIQTAAFFPSPCWFWLLQIARKVGCWRSDEDEMLTCLKMSDPVGLTMAGKIDVMLILGKGPNS